MQKFTHTEIHIRRNSHAEIHDFPYFRRIVETWISVKEMKSLQKFMIFRTFRWNPENMNFRQGNESTTEIHEFPYFRRDGEKWISVKEMKSLQKLMNFCISVEILKTWFSVKEMKALQKFMNFRISVEMVKHEFPWRKWKHFRNSWISVFP